ncbi:hypothetical protein [Jiangella anatolica]|uniref:Uncharacterized protein n=1 Tax=Jiangella anatolica TaxID=2670374 RepID=A0A2W2B3U1_9ACTN|nr:hypothetical protein [Jiangella anatolica]PZF79620.1 hypothetical protein C1I92_30210 [Jiangella anatolica]
MARPLGPPGTPPPPRNSAVGEDALSIWLRDHRPEPAADAADAADEADEAEEADIETAPAAVDVGDLKRHEVLTSIADAGAATVRDLRARTNLSQVQLGMILGQLSADGAISIEGEPGEEVVRKAE